jgi:hypothetical protein
MWLTSVVTGPMLEVSSKHAVRPPAWKVKCWRALGVLEAARGYCRGSLASTSCGAFSTKGGNEVVVVVVVVTTVVFVAGANDSWANLEDSG